MTAHTMEWIAYALGAAVLIGFLYGFMKSAVQRMAPSSAAAIFSVMMLGFSLVNTGISGTMEQLVEIDNVSLFLNVLGGALRALVWLCLFASLSTGGVQRVAPVMELHGACVAVAAMVLGNASYGIWKLCCVLLVLLGTVLMESRTQRGRGYRWLLFACLALVAEVGLTLYEDKYLLKNVSSVRWAAECVAACVFLWVLVFAGGASKALKRIKLENWLFLVLSGVAAGLTLLCDGRVHAMGDASFLYPVAGLVLPFAMLAGSLFHKEKMPASAVIGMLLAMGGSFGILLGL